jgi:radical SAM superfamily enzyme YgiQ (UPF0313 family)
MKILLIYPHCLEARLHAEDIRTVPIGVYYIAAVLKENHYDVEILNWNNINEAPHKIEHINGIAFRKAGEVLKTDDAEAIRNLDEVPNPAKYFKYQHLLLTRGCSWKCRFCGSPQF